MILSQQDIQTLLDCSPRTAAEHVKNIKAKFKTDLITKFHLADFLAVDFLAIEAMYQHKIKGDFDMAIKVIHVREEGLLKRMSLKSMCLSLVSSIPFLTQELSMHMCHI